MQETLYQNTSGKSFQVFFNEGPFAGSHFSGELSFICPSATCSCTDMTFRFTKEEDPSLTFEITLDVVKRTFNTRKTASEDEKRFGEALVGELHEDDWLHLLNLHQKLKEEQIAHAEKNIDSVSFDFSFIDDSIRNGAMVGYHEVFPISALPPISYDNEHYFIEDQYCLNPTCGCRDVVLGFYYIDEEQKKAGPSSQNKVFRFYYTKKKWESQEPNGSLDKAFLAEVEEQIPDLAEVTKTRHKTLRAIYANYRKNKAPDTHSLPKTAKVGRNDPCPCGSGKKYKKCCMIKGL